MFNLFLKLFIGLVAIDSFSIKNSAIIFVMKKTSNYLFLGFLSLIIMVNLIALEQPVTTNKPLTQDSGVRVFSTIADYDDAKEDLLTAIEDNGLVVSYTAHAKAMFDRTAAVTGAKTPIYNQAEIVLFCKADLSHDLVVADPHNLVLCPYAIAIYVLHKEPKRVYLSYREQDKSQAVTKPISDLLKTIIEEVL